jgi:hypothetical protein
MCRLLRKTTPIERQTHVAGDAATELRVAGGSL